MLKFKKDVSSIFLIVVLSLIVLLVSGFQANAENTNNQVTVSGQGDVEKKQDQKKSVGAVEAFKNMLFGDSNSSDDENGEENEEQELMENALEYLEMADKYWKKGDIENTLNELDKAYALILDADGDPAIARQKDDLRL